VRIHLAGEHALEFQLLHALGVAFDVATIGLRRVLVVFHLDQFEQLVRALEAFGQFADAVDGLVEQRTLAAQGLRACGVVPDVGLSSSRLTSSRRSLRAS
jgi:hypothetical protein